MRKRYGVENGKRERGKLKNSKILLMIHRRWKRIIEVGWGGVYSLSKIKIADLIFFKIRTTMSTCDLRLLPIYSVRNNPKEKRVN